MGKLKKNEAHLTVANKNDEPVSKTIIEMPELDGDSQIWVGQAVVTLIRMANENNTCYSDKTQHFFNVNLMSSILEELNVTLDEIKDFREKEKENEKFGEKEY